jgi:hypothetical protein
MSWHRGQFIISEPKFVWPTDSWRNDPISYPLLSISHTVPLVLEIRVRFVQSGSMLQLLLFLSVAALAGAYVKSRRSRVMERKQAVQLRAAVARMEEERKQRLNRSPIHAETL